jgi:hypothetical protein
MWGFNRLRWRKIENFKKGDREIWIKFAVMDGLEGWLTSRFKNGKDCFFLPNPAWSQPGFVDKKWEAEATKSILDRISTEEVRGG